MQLDPTAFRQGWTSCLLYDLLPAGRWHILGVVVKCHTWRQSETSGPYKMRSEQLAHTSKIICLGNALKRECQVFNM